MGRYSQMFCGRRSHNVVIGSQTGSGDRALPYVCGKNSNYFRSSSLHSRCTATDQTVRNGINFVGVRPTRQYRTSTYTLSGVEVDLPGLRNRLVVCAVLGGMEL